MTNPRAHLRMIDGDGNKNPAPTEEVLLPIQKPDKGTGELSSCHPGNFPDANPEADPEDMGGELGASGNTLYAMQDGYAINEKLDPAVFSQEFPAGTPVDDASNATSPATTRLYVVQQDGSKRTISRAEFNRLAGVPEPPNPKRQVPAKPQGK